MGEKHPKEKKKKEGGWERKREANVCAWLLHSIWHTVEENLFGQMLCSNHYTANPLALQETVREATNVRVDNAQGTRIQM